MNLCPKALKKSYGFLHAFYFAITQLVFYWKWNVSNVSIEGLMSLLTTWTSIPATGLYMSNNDNGPTKVESSHDYIRTKLTL